MPVGQRTAGGFDDLQRAGNPRAVARLQAFGRDGIAPRQFGMQRFDTVAFQPGANGIAHFGRDRRHRGETARQRLEVQAGPADEDGQALFRARLRQHLGSIRHPGAGRKIDRCVDMAIEPVRRAGLLLHRRPRRDDAEIAIDLHGIGVDDDSAGLLRQFERQGRLAAGGRPCDKHGLAQIKRIRLHVPRRHPHLQPGQSRARHHHRRRRAGRSPLAGNGAMAVRRSGSRHSLRLSGQEPGRHQGDRNPPASRRAATCRSTLSCSLSRPGARSFFWRTWIPP